MTGEDFAGGDDGGERTSGEHIDGGETGRILGTDVLRALLVHHLVRRRTTVVLLHARHEAESHRAHDGRRVEADDLRMNYECMRAYGQSHGLTVSTTTTEPPPSTSPHNIDTHTRLPSLLRARLRAPPRIHTERVENQNLRDRIDG